jgi:hypothetical protein
LKGADDARAPRSRFQDLAMSLVSDRITQLSQPVADARKRADAFQAENAQLKGQFAQLQADAATPDDLAALVSATQAAAIAQPAA